ncbi:MAG: chromate resistance protein ChrB domain-containing protein [Caulobacteraceae bacterium]
MAAIDFFDAPSRREVEQRLGTLDLALRAPSASPDPAQPLAELTGRTWVTRRGVHVDRIACAWLIRRFVDPQAAFKFVAPGGYVPEPAELRFDMFEAEFTHEGDKCSFEVLLARRRLADPALHAVGEIIHDIDIKDGKFRREETAGVAHLIDGIVSAHDDDERRIARGSAMLDDLYVFFGGRG